MLAASTSFADDSLASLYRQALSNDADFAAARSAYEAESESRAIGLAGLLPSVSLGAARTRDHLNRQEVSGNTDYHRDARYDPKTVTLRLSQPLFDLARWAAYKEGDARSARAEVVFADARQDLTLRLSQAYFNYLLAADNLELARAQKKGCSRRVPPRGPMSRKPAPAISLPRPRSFRRTAPSNCAARIWERSPANCRPRRLLP